MQICYSICDPLKIRDNETVCDCEFIEVLWSWVIFFMPFKKGSFTFNFLSNGKNICLKYKSYRPGHS